MWPFNDKKRGGEDPIIKNHLQETASGYAEDDESVHDVLMQKYPSPESAIEDYRKKYITDDELKKRFTADEIEYIYKECAQRDAEDSAIPTSF